METLSRRLGESDRSVFGNISYKAARVRMRLAEKHPLQKVQAVCRRTLFALALLGVGVASSLFTGAYSNERGQLFNMTSPERWSGVHLLSIYRFFTGFSGLWIGKAFPLSLDHYFNALIWGIGFSPVILLGAWMVTRIGWWETWFGRIRATVYVSAYLYGSILTAVAQRWTNELAPNGLPRGANGPAGLFANYSLKYHFPGTQINAYYNDYSRPATDIVLLLAVVLIFTPMTLVCNSRMGIRRPNERPSIKTFLWWTALTAVTLSYLRFLCQWYSPDTGYSSLTFSFAMAEFTLETLPATATAVIAIFWFASTPRVQIRYALFALIGLLILDFLCDRIAIGTLDHFGLFHRREGPLGGPDRWAFQTGRIVGAWTGLAIVARLGVSISAPAEKTEHIKA